MQNPPEEKPLAGMRYFALLFEHDSIIDVASLLTHGSVDIKNYKYYKKDYVPPPNDRIAE